MRIYSYVSKYSTHDVISKKLILSEANRIRQDLFVVATTVSFIWIVNAFHGKKKSLSLTNKNSVSRADDSFLSLEVYRFSAAAIFSSCKSNI